MQSWQSWSDLGRATGHALFRCRDVLVPLAVALLVVGARRDDFLAPPALDRWLDALGAFAIVTGLAIRSLVMATTTIRRSGVHRRVAAPTLLDGGPYAWCRNPLYLANATILVGLTLLFDSRWMVGLALPAALLGIRSIVAAEERVLLATFGDRYRDYCRRVPRFLPRPSFPPGPSGAALAYDWRRALRKEHGTAFAAVSVALAFAAAEDAARLGLGAWHWREPMWLGTWLLAAALWAAVRVWKHTVSSGELPITPQATAAAAPAVTGGIV
jgi:protein-S-isoprenylcysteine O-methyltransferase Ste14